MAMDSQNEQTEARRVTIQVLSLLLQLLLSFTALIITAGKKNPDSTSRQ